MAMMLDATTRSWAPTRLLRAIVLSGKDTSPVGKIRDMPDAIGKRKKKWQPLYWVVCSHTRPVDHQARGNQGRPCSRRRTHVPWQQLGQGRPESKGCSGPRRRAQGQVRQGQAQVRHVPEAQGRSVWQVQEAQGRRHVQASG
jgi:hypothetical protein